MALELDFSLEENSDCDTITFEDTTPTSTTDNTGYGEGTNPTKAEIDDTEFVVTTPDGDEITFDKGYLPPDGTVDFVPSDFNMGDEFEDGLYKLKYTVTDSDPDPDVTATVENPFFLHCQTFNCLEDNILKNEADKCDCQDDLDTVLAILRNRYESALLQFEKGIMNSAEKTLNRVKDKCDRICGDCW